jgi:hypothetical protein
LLAAAEETANVGRDVTTEGAVLIFWSCV